MPKKFKFELGQQVVIPTSGETGKVQGRAQYTNSEDTYYVNYKSADGRAVTAWWPETDLEVSA